MTKLYIIRHGETEWNIIKKIQGHEDTYLTENGVKQAEKIADRLKYENIDCIYSSDLKRAYDTAKVIGDTINLQVEVMKDLREIHFGPWQGLTLEEVKSKYKKEHILWRTRPHDLTLQGGETLIELQERILKTIHKLIEKHQGRHILIVSHGAAIKALLLGILDIDLSHYNKLSIDNVGLSIIQYKKHNPVIRVLNDTNHTREVSF